MSPRGGTQPGAGKPALYNKPMKRYNVMLDEETVKLAIALGGNLSAGLRMAVSQANNPPNTDGGVSAPDNQHINPAAG